jgi:uncharacterized protein YjbI with pentapeptide repeats
LFWLIERSVAEQPQVWVFLRDLLADVYGWWAEGVHLRMQPGRERGRVVWRDPYVMELAKWAQPYTDANAEPHRTATIDGRIGYALVQITAWVHSRTREQHVVRGSHRPYQRNDAPGMVRFCPGNGFLRRIMARWETVVMPFVPNYILPDVVLVNEDLGGAELAMSDLTRAELLGADLGGADLSYVGLEGATFSRVVEGGPDVPHNEWKVLHAVMSRARLRGADLSGATLAHMSFEGVDLMHAQLAGTDLSYTSFLNSRLDGTLIRNCAFSHSTLMHVDLSRAEIAGVDFSHAICSDVDFTKANLRDVSFGNAALRRVNFSACNLKEVNFSQARLEGVEFARANMEGVGLRIEPEQD